MSAANPIAVSEEEPFVIGKSDLAYFFNNPCRCDCALVLLCTSGHAQVTVDLRRGPLQLNTIVLLLPGSVLMFDDASADFSVRFGAFSPDLFGEAGFRLGLSFFSFLKENPISQVNERMAAGLSTWFEIMDYTYQDRGNMFRKTIVRNRLQNIMLELYDKIQRKVSSQCPTTSNRQMELFHRFVSLVHDCCIEEREVSFYADKLCISTRYLSAIVRRTTHQSAKELIDKIVIMEIKVLLQNTTLPIQEIAIKCISRISLIWGVISRNILGSLHRLSGRRADSLPTSCPERFYGRSPRFTRADFSVRVKRFYGLPLRSSM